MKKLIAVFLAALLVCSMAGCNNNSDGKAGNKPITERTAPLGYGINAHVYEFRPYDATSNMDYVSEMTGILGVEYYRLQTTHSDLFDVGEGDTLTFKEGQKELLHRLIEKMSAAGVKYFVAVSDGPLYPYGYEATAGGVVPDPAAEKEMYDRYMKMFAKGWAMIVEEYPEITHVETINEPDLEHAEIFTKQGHLWGVDDGYKYSLDDKAHMVADMNWYCYREVKAVRDEVIVTTPGFANYGESTSFMDDLYEAIESGAHPYGEEVADTNPDHYFDMINSHKYLDADMSIDEYFDLVDSFYKACERHDDAGKPAIITECGFTDSGNAAQEQENGERMSELLELYEKRMPYLEAILIYKLNDFNEKEFTLGSGEDNFGLFESAGNKEKPSYPKLAAVELYKYMHKTEDVSPLYKYCPDLMPKQ